MLLLPGVFLEPFWAEALCFLGNLQQLGIPWTQQEVWYSVQR